jgi:hypothetical protein
MKSKQKKLTKLIIVIAGASLLMGTLTSFGKIQPLNFQEADEFNTPPIISNYEQFIQGNFSGYEFSNYYLSVFLDEDTSTVAGNLTVDFYNDDPINFTQIPFHIYPSGMEFIARPGYIEILNVSASENPKEELDFEVFNSTQLMWVNLTAPLVPGNRTSFIISFNTTLPDGGIGRASDHGWDHNQSRIFKFGSSYPLPCVYDEFDGWNVDPYILTGDPFYNDMAYYDLIINVPENMTVAATGKPFENVTIGNRTIYHYDPILPVREVTFSASYYFVVESFYQPDVNVTVSFYYLNKSYWLWHDFIEGASGNAGGLFNSVFGNYTYPTLNVVQDYSHYGGMEYPLQVYAAESADRATDPYWWLETIVVHEIAHQWFYGFVGIDQIDWGFLDEGLACWATDLYKYIFHPDWNMYSPYWGVDDVNHYSLKFGLPNKINQSIPECLISGTDYYYGAYTKTPTIFQKLSTIIGLNNFAMGLQLFTHENYFKIARLTDLQTSMETIVGQSLDWFFFPWFDNPYLPKYNITSAIYDASSKVLNITVEDLNEQLNQYDYSQQIPLYIYDTNSNLEYSENNWVNGSTTLLIPLERTPARVVLNYTDSVLVQFSDVDLNYVETTDITIINVSFPSIIPGYNLIFIILIVSVFGIISILRKSRIYRK